jgi:hypothetical protein
VLRHNEAIFRIGIIGFPGEDAKPRSGISGVITYGVAGPRCWARLAVAAARRAGSLWPNGLFELGLERGAPPRLSAFPSTAVLTSRVDLEQAVGLSGLRSGGRRTAKRRLADRIRALSSMNANESSELQPRLERAELTTPPEMIKTQSFQAVAPLGGSRSSIYRNAAAYY